AQQPQVDPSLVRHALAIELQNAADTRHPMRYRLRKASPRLSTTKEIIETKDGAVARLVAINDQPLSLADEQKEQSRLDNLLSDPGQQRHRKQTQENDTDRAIRVLRALPDAFIYTYAGSAASPTGRVEKFTFQPNSGFTPADLETQVLPAMSGEIWIDPVQQRVVRLEGHIDHDVSFGWGLLGRLYKGGTIVIEQAEVGNRQWRIVRMQLAMNGRVFFKARNFDTVEQESRFEPVPLGLGYVEAIRMLRSEPLPVPRTGR
ncbi:MAG TPA: hypothetical protein VG893_11340, partial [Terracidiphilus sp.]|nr:hypothetical protein [Terracidiphilus sp.]